MVWNFSKTFKLKCGPCSPKHGPVLFTVFKLLFVLMFCSHVKTFKFMAGPRSPTSSVTAQLNSRRWRIVSFWCCADIQHCSNERMVVLLQTRSRSIHGVDDYFYRVGMKLVKNIRTYGLVVLPQTRPSSFHGVQKPFRLNIKRSSLWLGRAPQQPLSRPSSFRGVEESFRFDVMQTFNNVQMNGCLCSPKHGPMHFTVLKNLFVWMVWNFSKTFELMARLCSPKHGPVLFTVFKTLFVWMLCSHVKTFKFMAGPRSRTSSVTAQLISRRWKIVSFWCYADIQQRSKERLFVLPETRSKAFHGVEEPFLLDGMKLFKNIRTYGWAVFSQTRPSSVHGVDGIYFYAYFAAMQKHSSLWLGRAPQHPLSRPSSFRGFEESFRFDFMQTFNNVQMIGRLCSPKRGPGHFTVLTNLFIWMVWNFSKTFKLMAWPCSPKHGPVLFTVLRILFVLMFGSHVKTIKFMARPRSPTSPVTAQLISRRWRIVSFWCCADFH